MYIGLFSRYSCVPLLLNVSQSVLLFCHNSFHPSLLSVYEVLEFPGTTRWSTTWFPGKSVNNWPSNEPREGAFNRYCYMTALFADTEKA